MIRTHIIPNSNNVSIPIPDSYIGKKVEVIVFADDDIQQTLHKSGKISNTKASCLKKELWNFKNLQNKLEKNGTRTFN